MAHTKSPMNNLRLSAIAALSIFSACGGGSSSSGEPFGSGFELFSMSVPEDAIWQVNRPIEFKFSRDVDFSTVSLNTIAIRDLNGLPASGAFTLVDSNTVSFQPTCPVLGDLSDSGLKIGGVPYQITVLGSASGSGLSVRSVDGEGIDTAQLRNFVTPASSLSAVAFFDPQTGPPSPVVRQLDSMGAAINPEDQVTYIETAGGAGPDVEFTFDTATQVFSKPENQGLNLFSDNTTDVALLIEFNQPVNPADDNISNKRLFLEYLADPLGSPVWTPLPTEVSLERNCTETGATLRLQPLGMIPQSTEIRAVISTEFEDLVGDRNQLQVDTFARFKSTIINFAGLTPATDMGDEFKEDFNFNNFEDKTAPFSEPRAIWSDGQLSAAYSFSGSGGVDGAFDWVVPSGVTILLDTSGAVSIQGGDIGVDMMTPFVNTKSQIVTAGRVDVRHLVVEAGAVIKVQGVNPVQIQASGNVVIEGLIDLSGFDRPDVATLNTGNQPEVGSAGAAGGGTGGTASFLTTTSTPQGGNGFGYSLNGPVANFGGKGGESGFGLPALINRRPGGGGGGILGPNSTSTDDNLGVTFGMIAQTGFDGGASATGSISNAKPPRGGNIGNSIFIDSTADNDFFGTKFDQVQNKVIIGELTVPWAGSGGGAGGDAVKDNTFPHKSWTVATDEKGSGGAGAAGSLRILCLGTVTIRDAGKISAKGGKGGAGENTINTNHLGGGGGGGSGGHVIIEAGSAMIFDNVFKRCITARGGQGGKGASGVGSINAGGAGGPGIIQIHVLDPLTDIQFVNTIPEGDTLDEVTWPDAITLVPSFGARSRAITNWIPVGQASIEPDGIADQVTFLFGGTNAATGSILDLDDDDQQDDLLPILGPTALVGGEISLDGRTLTVDANPLKDSFNDVYLRNPQLLRDSLLVLNEVGTPANSKRFNVASASFDIVSFELSLEVDGAPAESLLSFTPGGGIEFSLIPVSLSASTIGGGKGFYPDSVDIKVRFQSAGVGADGLPDLSAAGFQDWTPDIDLVNAKAPGTVEFIRLEVLFDLDALGTGLSATSPRPLLDFARIGWRF